MFFRYTDRENCSSICHALSLHIPTWACMERMSVYQRVKDDCTEPVVVDEAQVSSLLEERHTFRVRREWEDADLIFRKLVAMGVLIDDKKKIWNLGSTPKEVKQPTELGQFACETCSQRFMSRNQLFKHLRNPGPCSLDVAEKGNNNAKGYDFHLETGHATSSGSRGSTSTSNKKQREGRARAARSHADANVCLWLGDLPSAWAHPRRVAQLLYRYTPRGVEQAWVKKVMKRGYKDKSGRSLGYAILCYRDVEEATQVRKALDGLEVSLQELYKGNSEDHPEALEESFVIRVHQAEHGDSTLNQPEPRQLPSDPPLLEQLRPLPLSELQKRVASKLEDRERLLELVAAKLESPRKTRFLKGVPLPAHLSLRLVTELQRLRWPAKNHRPCLTSDRYLVLHRNAKDSYGQLRSLCSDLMNWADPSFHYSGIAVTKNFVASPHIDEQDKSFQFAVSLGDFHGGELCIEEDPDSVAIIDTRNRIACIDGRFVHWVKNYTDGDRYSLIFYDTSDRPWHNKWTWGFGSKVLGKGKMINTPF